MEKRIIYPTENGGVAVIIPAPDWLAQPGNSIEKLAQKDVPPGVPYQIVDVSDLPSEPGTRDAWVWSE